MVYYACGCSASGPVTLSAVLREPEIAETGSVSILKGKREEARTLLGLIKRGSSHSGD